MVARRSPQCLGLMGWLLVCLLIGSTGTCLAAKFTLPTALRNQKLPDNGLLHPIPLQAELIQLNNTLSVLAHATGQRANLLTQQAAKDAWNAVQVALKPIAAAQQSTSISRRKLQQESNTVGFPFLTPELSELLTARLRTAAQSALQLQSGQQQQQPLSAASFLSPELSEMISSRLRSAAQNAFQSQVDQFGQQYGQQLLQSAFGGNVRAQFPQFNASSIQGITDEVNKFRADAKERLGSLTQTIKTLRNVETLMDNIFDQAKKIRGVQTASKEGTQDIISVAPAKTRRLQQVSSSSSSASATGANAAADSGSDAAASLALEQLINATLANLTVGPAASTTLSSSTSSASSTPGSSSSSASSISARRRLHNVDGGEEEDDHVRVVRDLQFQVSDVLAALESLQGGAVVQDDAVRRRLMAQARGLENRFQSKQVHNKRRRRLQQDDHVFLNPSLVDGDGEQTSDSFAGRYASEGARSGPQGDLSEFDGVIEDFDILQASAGAYTGPTHIQNTVVILMPPVNNSADAAMVGDMLDLIQELVQSAFIPLPQMSMPSALLQQAFQTLSEIEGYGMAPAPEGESFDYDTFAEAPAAEEEEAQSYRRRRNMLSLNQQQQKQQQQQQRDSSFTYKSAEVDAEDADYDYDMDAEDDAWIWEIEDQDMAPQGLGRNRLEEALFGFSSGEDGIMELVISMTAPVEEGGIPPAMLHLLADPQGASVAELLELLSSPNFGGYHIDSSSMAASQAQMPRFAVFGPSAASSAEHMGMAHSSVQTATVTKKERNGRISELIVVPLSGAAKAPIPHGQMDTPIGMDARWWGVVLSLGALGLLLVGASLATLKLSPTASRDFPGEFAGEFDSVHGGQRGGGARTATAASQQEGAPLQEPVSPWESKVQQKDLIRSKVEKTPRKTSNLPA